MKKLQFTVGSSGSQKGRMLICPECLESVSQTDIETYSACPYCNHHFEQNSELEDFILRPVVDHWMEQYMPRQRDGLYINNKPVC